MSERVPLTAGVDEAGRGPLAGPVVAAAVVLGERVIEGLADSKTLSAARRECLAEAIRAGTAAWAIAVSSVPEIDEMNILRATFLAMRRAVDGLPEAPEAVLVDGPRIAPGITIPQRAVVRGDATVPAISAASILAKTHRDALMREADLLYPQYGFARHKGYGTAEHLAALAAYGPCPLHRRSFAPVRACWASAEDLDAYLGEQQRLEAKALPDERARR